MDGERSASGGINRSADGERGKGRYPRNPKMICSNPASGELSLRLADAWVRSPLGSLTGEGEIGDA